MNRLADRATNRIADRVRYAEPSIMNGRGPELLLSVGSRFENIELVQVILDDSLQRLDFDEDSRYWIGIAVRESVANAIQHGNRESPEKWVDVELSLEQGQVVIRVQDQGEGFDPTTIDDPLDPDNLLRPDGRGIFYMNRFMDEIEYTFRPGGGTIVTLRKTIVALRADAAQEEDDA